MEIQTTYINSYCTIANNEICLDGKSVFKLDSAHFSEFSKAAYKNFDLNYPKFFKMDNLSKLAFLGASFLLENQTIATQENNTALVLTNKASSLDTDLKHQKSISDKENYFPSPAVFVYTLPNICLGEISIRYQLKSENSFFIFDAFNPSFMANYANILIQTHKADAVLCGWVEYLNEEYTAFLYLVSKEGTLEHNEQSLIQLYKK